MRLWIILHDYIRILRTYANRISEIGKILPRMELPFNSHHVYIRHSRIERGFVGMTGLFKSQPLLFPSIPYSQLFSCEQTWLTSKNVKRKRWLLLPFCMLDLRLIRIIFANSSYDPVVEGSFLYDFHFSSFSNGIKYTFKQFITYSLLHKCNFLTYS